MAERLENSSVKPLLENENHEQEISECQAEKSLNPGTDDSLCGSAGCGFLDSKRKAGDQEARSAATRKLSIAMVLCLIFIAVEVAGGLISNSLAILTDAAHLLSDVAGFAISLFAIWAASWKATPRQSYGYYRLEILGAFLSLLLIWLLTGIIVYEAILRIVNSSKAVDGRLMFLVACFGLVVNIIMVFLLGSHGHSHGDHSANGHGHGHKHHKHSADHEVNSDSDLEGASATKHEESQNINIKGAWLHVFGDLIQSIGVMIGGAIIWAKPTWKVVDLICTLLFSVLVLCTTISMLRDIVEILMESVPREIDVQKLEKGLCDIPGVISVHDLHIWAITMGKTLLACHVTVLPEADADSVLRKASDFCETVFNISHVTVQVERQPKSR